MILRLSLVSEKRVEAALAVYRGGAEVAQARGFGHGLRVGYAVGRHARAMDDAELVEAVGRWVLDQENLGREVRAVMRATVADLEALRYRQRAQTRP